MDDSDVTEIYYTATSRCQNDVSWDEKKKSIHFPVGNLIHRDYLL